MLQRNSKQVVFMLKRKMMIPAILIVVLFLCAFVTTLWATCPEEPNDRGECDTMYVEPWPADLFLEGDPPYFVRIPIFVTCDVADVWDSIGGFIIPLCYTHTNPSKYCSVGYFWNTTWTLWLFPDFSTRSIFRHMVEGTDTLYHNRMADMAADFMGRDWDAIILNLRSDSSWHYWNQGADSAFLPPHFWMVLAASDVRDQWWWEGSRVLLATMTFKLEDTMTICIDTCCWPRTGGLAWGIWAEGGGAMNLKVPRLGTPHDPASYEVCFYPSYSPVRVTSPAGGKEWCVGSTHEITWDCYGIENVRIEYAIEVGAGSSWIPIVDSTPCRDESYPWTIPDSPSSTCRVRICDLTYSYPCDYSNGYFSIIQCLPGDANGDQMVGLLDLVFLVTYLYQGGGSPVPMANGDVNADCVLDLTDVVYLINYLLRAGPPPLVGCA